MNNPMLKFIMKGKKNDMVHTSVYAKAQNSGGIGVASTRSFADRMKIKGNRQRVREYNDSRVVTQAYAASGVKAKKYEMPESKDVFLNKNKQADAFTTTKPIDSSNKVSSFKTTIKKEPRNDGLSRPPAIRNPGISKKI